LEINKKKSLLISCLVLNGSRSGYKTIIKNLVENSINDNSQNYHNIFVFQKSGWESLELELKKVISNKSTKVLIFKSFKSKWIRAIFEQLIIILLAIYYKSDYIFMPCTFGLILPIKKTITFVHTNTSFKLPRKLRGRGYIQQLAHNLMIKVTSLTSYRLLFTSAITKDEYIKFNNIKNTANLYVIENGINTKRFKDGDKLAINELVNEKFILSVSQIYRLKNFDNLIKSYLQFVKYEESLIKLVIVGTIQEKDYFNELQEISSWNENIIFLQNVLDSELNWLYKNCEIYILLSFFEGFSLTPAEAICSGKSIILSDINVHRKIYAGLAEFVDPNSVDLIYRAILNRKRNIISPNKREEFIKKISLELFINRLYKEIFYE
tara:strand:- start:2139 stop:3278 length:1140 start_codon:yes stop_codon:yes gene_type:complete